jgi:hypothetical protein
VAVLRGSASLAGDDEALAGVLRLSLRERRPRAGEVDGFTTESEQVESPLLLRRR